MQKNINNGNVIGIRGGIVASSEKIEVALEDMRSVLSNIESRLLQLEQKVSTRRVTYTRNDAEVLKSVMKHDKGASSRDIEKDTALPQSSVSKSVKKLRLNQLVDVRLPTDRKSRSRFFCLAEKSKEAIEKLPPELRRYIQEELSEG